MVAHNFMFITGWRRWIMAAAHWRRREHSFGLNIRLPFEQHATVLSGTTPTDSHSSSPANYLVRKRTRSRFSRAARTMDEGLKCCRSADGRRDLPSSCWPAGGLLATDGFLTGHLVQFGYVGP